MNKIADQDPTTQVRTLHIPAWRLLWHFLLAGGDLFRLFSRLNRHYGERFKARLFGHTILFTTNAPDAAYVLLHQEKRFAKTKFSLELSGLVGMGTVTAVGKMWRQKRLLLQPLFTVEAIDNLMPMVENTIKENFETLELKLKSNDNHLDTNLVDLVHDIMLDATVMFIFGEKLGKEKREIIEVVRFFMAHISRGVATGWLTQRFFKGTMARHRKTMDRIVADLLSTAQKKPLNAPFMAVKLLQQYQNGMHGKDAIRDEAVTLLLAGFETTANSIIWTLYEWAKNPISEQNALKEMTETGVSNHPHQFIDLTQAQTFFNPIAAFAEALRLYPPSWLQARNVIMASTVGKTPLEVGDLVIFPPYFIHRNARHWPEPMKFDPSRWQSKDFDGSTIALAGERSGSYLPFAFGPRTCIGKDLATAEAQIILSNFVKRFHLKLNTSTNAKPIFNILMRPPSYIGVQLRARNNERNSL